MKVLACGHGIGRHCTCWCHASDTKNECGCYVNRTAREAAVIANLQKRQELKVRVDKRRDGSPLPEVALENYLRMKVQRMGGTVVKMMAGADKGIPDRLVMIPFGRIYLVEMKTSVGKPSAKQIVWHDRARKMGHVVHVINTRDKIDNFVRWAVATGAGLKDGKRQAQKDWDAMKSDYAYAEHEE